MSLVRGYLRRPRKVRIGRLSFQIHLRVGLILTLYTIMIGLTGSILRGFVLESIETIYNRSK